MAVCVKLCIETTTTATTSKAPNSSNKNNFFKYRSLHTARIYVLLLSCILFTNLLFPFVYFSLIGGGTRDVSTNRRRTNAGRASDRIANIYCVDLIGQQIVEMARVMAVIKFREHTIPLHKWHNCRNSIINTRKQNVWPNHLMWEEKGGGGWGW